MIRRALVLALFLVVALTGCGAKSEQGPISGLEVDDQDGYAAAAPATPYPVTDATFTNSFRERFTFGKDTAGKVNLVFFGYSQCPDTCQIVMSTIASAVKKLSPEQSKQVQMVFVTTDPARDTPEVLRAYLERYNPDFIGVTGSLSKVVALGKPWGISVDKGAKLPSGGYEVDHTTSVLGLDGRRDPQTIPLVWSAATSPVAMAADLDKLLSTKD